MIGAIAGALPGVHPNLVAAVAVGAAPVAPALAIPALLAALGAHSVTSFLPSLWGAPDESHAGAELPAHRLVRAGRAGDAVQASLAGSMGGLACGLALAFAVGGLLDVAAYDRARPLVPVLVLAAWLLVAASERSWRARAIALFVGGVAGALGIGALGVPLASPLDVAASPLTPLLSGLFAVPVLVRLRPVDAGAPARGGRARVGAWPLIGTLAAVPASILPGFTSGPATAASLSLWRGEVTPVQAIATASAVNTAVAVVATAVLHGIGRARSGVHVAAAAVGRFPTPGAFPAPELVADLSTVATGALVGAGLLVIGARLVAHAPPWSVTVAAIGSLVGITVLTWATGGWAGLTILAAAATVGELPGRLGVRRSQLMACLMVPVLWRALVGV